MRIGVPTEVKTDEYRVAITPAGVRELTSRGHEVLVQAGAGEGSAMSDEQFTAQGARMMADADAVFAGAELVLKVKEPQPGEVSRLREGQTLFTYLHLAAEPELALGLEPALRAQRADSPERKHRERLLRERIRGRRRRRREPVPRRGPLQLRDRLRLLRVPTLT